MKIFPRFATATLSALAVAAPLSSRAAYWDWQGHASETRYFEDKSSWYGSDTSAALSGSNHWLGYNNSRIKGEIISFRSMFSLTGLFTMGANCTHSMILDAGQIDYGINSTAEFAIENASNSGSVMFRSGTYTFSKITQNGRYLAVGDGSSDVKLASKGNIELLNGSKFSANGATLDLKGNFNVRANSVAGVTNSQMSAACINVAVNANANSTVLFNGGSAVLTSVSAVGYSKTSAGTLETVDFDLQSSGELILGGYDSSQTGAKGVVSKTGGDWTLSKLVNIAKQSGSTGAFTNYSGTVSASDDVYIGRSGGTGYLTVAGGTVTVDPAHAVRMGYGGGRGRLSLAGGVCEAASVENINDGSVEFSGGTLRANAMNANGLLGTGLAVNVGAAGGCIDAGGFNISVFPDLGAAGDTGAMRFCGGGSVAINGAVNYSGGTTLEAGTALGLASSNKNAVLAGLSVEIPSGGVPDGTVVATNATAGGTFTAAEMEGIALSGGQNGRYSLALAGEGTKIVIADAFAGEYVWNGGASGADWMTAGKWSKNGSPADWVDSVSAVFETDGDAASVAGAVTAGSVEFRADSAVSGPGTLTVPSVAVSQDVTAVISAPVAGSLEKTGTGTLVLSASRGDTTIVSEGTLSLSGGTHDVSKIVLGTDPAKEVALEAGSGAVLSNISSSWFVGDVEGVTASVRETGGDRTLDDLFIGCAASATTSFIHGGGALTLNGNLDIGRVAGAANSVFEISGGTVTNAAKYTHLGANSPGVMTVKKGGKYGVVNNKYGLIVAGRSSGVLNVDGGDVSIGGSLNLSYFGGEATVGITGGGVLAFDSVKHGGGGTGGASTIAIDGGTIRANVGNDAFIPDIAALTVTVGANGGTIDNNGNNIAIAKTMTGPGALALSGSGVTTLAAVQSYTGATTVKSGATLAASGLTLAGPVAFEAGATLAIGALSADSAAIEAASFSFANGAKISVPAVIRAGRYKLFTLSSGTFAADAADALDFDCAYPFLLDVEGDTIYFVTERGYATVNNTLASLAVSGTTELLGAGGVMLPSLSIPAGATLVFDPVSTPVAVSGTPEFAAGSKIALSAEYAAMSLGRVVLATYTGTAAIPEGFFDTSSIAPGATYALSQQTAPDGASTQLVLTVGDYASAAKEIRILTIGDSITHGYVKTVDGASQQAQYRTLLAARLSAAGYKPAMLGHLNRDASDSEFTCDAAGVRQPDEWIWHSGVSGDRIVQGGTRGGVRDNLHVYLDIAGEPDVVVLLAGTNDLGGGGATGESAFNAYTNLVWDIKRQRPRTAIVASTILEVASPQSYGDKVSDFNARLLAALSVSGALPDTYCLTNLYPVVPQSVHGNYFDGLHPTMKGFDPVAKGFAAKIEEALPFATYEGPLDDTLASAPQTALGVAGVAATAEGAALADYTNGMVHAFTIDASSAANNFAASAPYTARIAGLPLSCGIKKAGYFMELVRTGTSRRRWVWVDMDAAGKTLGDVDFPWDGVNMDFTADKLHVLSNDPSIHNVSPGDDSVTGVVEGTSHNYSGGDDNSGVPADLSAGSLGWNDTLGGSGDGYGCFQIHRVFSQTGTDVHWNNGEVLLAWNRWGAKQSSAADEIGIGTFFTSSAFRGGSEYSSDYTFTADATKGAAGKLDASAYQVRHLEIWVEVDPDAPAGVHGKWVGGIGDDRFSVAANWDDGMVPESGTTLDFREISQGTHAIEANAQGAVYNGILLPVNPNYAVEISGTLHLSAITNALGLSVSENGLLKVDGDAVLTDEGGSGNYRYMFRGNNGRIEIGGSFVNASTPAKGALAYYNASAGVLQTGGARNDGNCTFSLCGNHATTVTWLVGAAGLAQSAGSGFDQFASGNGQTTLKAADDFTVAAAINVKSSLKLDTSDESGAKHAITLGRNFEGSGAIVVSGSGTVLANGEADSYIGSNPVTVENGATLAINAGKSISTGLITVCAGAALSLPRTGVTAPGGNLTLEAGSTLVFAPSGDDSAVLNVTGRTLTLPDAGTVKIKFAGVQAQHPGATYTLITGAGLSDTSKFELEGENLGELSVSGGDLLYTAPRYFMIRIAGAR